MNIETKQKSKKILGILSYVLVFLLFICSLLCLIARFNGAKFSLFGNRYDVVLTDSMSYKNEVYADYLANDNNQFNRFDLAISRKLPSPEELKEHDVVIYTDRSIGTNMHRIVEINTSHYEDVIFTYAEQSEINGNKGVILNEVSSQILTNDIQFKTMSFTTFSTLETTDHFNFYALNKLYTPEISREQVDGGYKTTYKLVRDTEAPAELKISHKAIYDYSKEIITSVHIDSKAGVIDVNMDELRPSNDGNANLLATFNKEFKFKTRGDASKDDDGWYSYNELQALVVGNAKGMGYPIRFMGSIWGGLMFALLAILILVADIIMGRLNKKELAANKANASGEPKADDEKPEEKPEETPIEEKEEPEKPVEEVSEPTPVVEEAKNEPVKEETIEEQPKVEEPISDEKPAEEQPRQNGRFIPKGGKQKKIDLPPKNTRWTKDNNPSLSKKRAGGDK